MTLQFLCAVVVAHPSASPQLIHNSLQASPQTLLLVYMILFIKCMSVLSDGALQLGSHAFEYLDPVHGSGTSNLFEQVRNSIRGGLLSTLAGESIVPDEDYTLENSVLTKIMHLGAEILFRCV
jgi:hypothetical protein